MTTTKKCDYPACICVVPNGKKYCSETCADAKKVPETSCQCQHPECNEIGLKM